MAGRCVLNSLLLYVRECHGRGVARLETQIELEQPCRPCEHRRLCSKSALGMLNVN